jgi:hypothetical protein
MREDPKALGRGLLAFGGEAMSLVRGYASDDPAVREAAERKWARINEQLPKPTEADRPGSPSSGLSQADRDRLEASLRKVVAALEDAAREARGRKDV